MSARPRRRTDRSAHPDLRARGSGRGLHRWVRTTVSAGRARRTQPAGRTPTHRPPRRHGGPKTGPRLSAVSPCCMKASPRSATSSSSGSGRPSARTRSQVWTAELSDLPVGLGEPVVGLAVPVVDAGRRRVPGSGRPRTVRLDAGAGRPVDLLAARHLQEALGRGRQVVGELAHGPVRARRRLVESSAWTAASASPAWSSARDRTTTDRCWESCPPLHSCRGVRASPDVRGGRGRPAARAPRAPRPPTAPGRRRRRRPRRPARGSVSCGTPRPRGRSRAGRAARRGPGRGVAAMRDVEVERPSASSITGPVARPHRRDPLRGAQRVQPVEGGEVGPELAVGVRDDGRAAAEHGVAGQHGPTPRHDEGQRVGGVARCRDDVHLEVTDRRPRRRRRVPRSRGGRRGPGHARRTRGVRRTSRAASLWSRWWWVSSTTDDLLPGGRDDASRWRVDRRARVDHHGLTSAGSTAPRCWCRRASSCSAFGASTQVAEVAEGPAGPAHREAMRASVGGRRRQARSPLTVGDDLGGEHVDERGRVPPRGRRRRWRAGRPRGTSGRSAAASASAPARPPRRPTVRAATSPTTTRTTRRGSPAPRAAARRRTTCGSASARRPASASPTTRRAGRCAAPARGVSRKSVSDSSRDSSATRSASQSSPVVSSTTESADGAGQQHAGLLEGLPHGRAHQRARLRLARTRASTPTARRPTARPRRRPRRSRAGRRRRRGRRTSRRRTPSSSARRRR